LIGLLAVSLAAVTMGTLCHCICSKLYFTVS
jgi:hypothetical protein